MNKQAVIETLKNYLEQNARGPASAADVDLSLDEWLTSSLEVINMVLFLEKQFKIQMRDADISAENFATLDTLANFVLSKLSAN